VPKWSRRRYTRAHLRAQYRRAPKRSGSAWFYGALVVIIAAFGTGIVYFVASRESSDTIPPVAPNQAKGIPGDHWHAAISVNSCGTWLPAPPEFETAADNANVNVGIHTHGDGFIHIHPFYRSEAGDHATLGLFFKYGGWELSEDGFKVWPANPAVDPKPVSRQNGQVCYTPEGKRKEGRLVWTVNCKQMTGNPADYKLKDQDIIAIGFLPDGEKLGPPPNVGALPTNDGSEAAAFSNKQCAAAAAAATTTTDPSSASSTSTPST
jgi:hypothetical protein